MYGCGSHIACHAFLALLSPLQALALKAQGNELYKARKFDEAIEAYSKALELYDGDMSFLTNRSAVKQLQRRGRWHLLVRSDVWRIFE